MPRFTKLWYSGGELLPMAGTWEAAARRMRAVYEEAAS